MLFSENVTFIIPIFRLKSDRIRNLKFIIPYIINTECKILIVEQSKDELSDLSNIIPVHENIKHLLYTSNSEIFHKSGIINWAVKNHVDTKYVWVNDVDFYMKFDKVLSEDWNSDFIKPYISGKKLSADNTKKIIDGEKLNVSYEDKFAEYISLYGALSFIFEKNAFLSIGGMDETIFGWGKEDVELSARIKNLKIDVQEMNFKGIHLWHPLIKFADECSSAIGKKFFLNYYFDEIYCVNLDRRGDRWETVKKQFDDYGIKVRRYSAVDGKDITYDQFNPYICDKPRVSGKIVHEPGDIENKGALGCLMSHLNVIKDAKSRGYDRILIFEDDVVLNKNFNLEIEKIQRLDWKLVNLGASQYNWSSLFVGEDFYLSQNSYGTFAYAIDSSIYDLLIEKIESTKKTIDAVLISIQKELCGKCYTFYPNIAISYVDDSDIRDKLDMTQHAQQMRWDLSKFSLVKTQPKRVLLMPDARGWAFDTIAKAIVKYNPRPDKIQYEIMYVRDLQVDKLTINPSDWDLIYVMFEAERIVPRSKNVIRGCYSAYWLENTNYSPLGLGKYFSKCKGVVFANDELKNNLIPFLPDNFPVEVIHDASDETVFYPTQLEKNKEFTVVFVGNTKRKIKNFPDIKRICKDAGVNLQVCENLSHAELIHEYCNADLCINFSTFEGGPQTFVESALCGTPMLIRNTNAMSKIIPCFVGETTEDFVRTLNHLKVNRHECKVKGKEAYDVAISKFTYKQTAKKFAEFFLKNVNKLDLREELTVFVIRSGNNPNYNDCIAALENQNCSFVINEIVDVSPMSAAFQQMVYRCNTPYYVQVDEDMILDPNAIQRMYFSIKCTKSNVCMVSHMLRDAHLDFDIFGVKIYKHDIMVNYPYNLGIISCEKDQITRLETEGYIIDMIKFTLGTHSPKWSTELIYERYFDLMEKWKVYKYDWLADLPKKLYNIVKENPSDENIYAMLGAMASISTKEPIRKREKDFKLKEDVYHNVNNALSMAGILCEI